MAIKLGIRQLIEYTLKSGDLSPQTTSNNTAVAGARIHRKLQKQGGADYQKEVMLRYPCQLDQQDYLIEGRADGVIIDPDSQETLVDEIKTSTPAFSDLSQDALTRYWGQTKFYAWLLCEKLDLDQITGQLTYYQTTTDHITRTQKTWTRIKLKGFVQDVLERYEYWLHLRSNWCQKRDRAARALTFPYPKFRPQQRQFAGIVYKTCAAQKILLAEAPTGTGKTIATLFPAAKALGSGYAQRLFYLTAKTSTRLTAETTLKALRQSGARLKSITLTAKDKISFAEEKAATDTLSKYARGYYDRLKPALQDLFQHEDQWDRATIEKYAQKYTLSPFEFSLDASLLADVIIGDYNYLFDPQVYLQRFFANPQAGNIFLIDEAHNLVSRSREMYSDTLAATTFWTLDQKTQIKNKTRTLNDLHRALTPICHALQDLAANFTDPNADPKILDDPPETVMKAAVQSLEALGTWLSAHEQHPLREEVLDNFFSLNHFLKIADYYDENYRTILRADAKSAIQLLCLDASENLQHCLDKGDAAILFSATLTPMSYYQETLTNHDGDVLNYRMASPFPMAHQDVIITRQIQTTYTKRQANQDKIIAALTTMVQAQTGNYLIFLPSYQYLLAIATAFQAAAPQIQVITQAAAASEQEHQDFLKAFQSHPKQALVGFAVLGGAFAEGIDLRGDRLSGVAIISVGLPGLSLTNNLLQQHYQAKNHQGFAYAYQLPGFNKVLQAAGRLIRSETDRGVVLLIDARFANRNYRQLFPAQWQEAKLIHDKTALQHELHQFWQQQPPYLPK